MPERKLLRDRAPIEKPATWAPRTSSARSTPTASSAIVGAGRTVGQRVRPAPRLSKAASAVAVGEPVELRLPRLNGVAEATDQQHVGPVAALVDIQVDVAGAR